MLEIRAYTKSRRARGRFFFSSFNSPPLDYPLSQSKVFLSLIFSNIFIWRDEESDIYFTLKEYLNLVFFKLAWFFFFYWRNWMPKQINKFTFIIFEKKGKIRLTWKWIKVFFFDKRGNIVHFKIFKLSQNMNIEGEHRLFTDMIFFYKNNATQR